MSSTPSHPPTCCANTGPGGAPTPTGYGPPGDQPPVNTPRIIPEGGEDPSYTPCSTGGDPATASDPTDAQILTDAASPVPWIQITLPDATVLRYCGQGLPFTSGNGSVSTPRVTRWGSVTHALADEHGSFQAFKTSVTLSDTDRTIRGYLASAANRHVDGREAILFIETRANAALGVAPRVLARGVITSWKANAHMEIELEISDPLGYRYAAIALDRPLPHRRIRADLFPSCPDHNLNRAVPIIYGDYSDDFTWSVDPRRTPIGIAPVIHVGPADQINGLGGGGEAFVIAGHAIGGVQSVFGSNLDETAPGSVRLPLGTFTYYESVDVTGIDGTVERFAMMTGSGPIVDDHINGRVPITMNLCGIEDNGDSSGDVITNLASQVQHFLTYFALQNYTTGTWGAVPTFPGGTPKVRTTSFNTIRTTHAARVGTGAYVGSFYIGQQKPTRQWLAELQVGSDIRLGINHHGQVVGATLDDQASLAGLTTFTTAHIEESLFDIDPQIDAIYNVLEYQCGLEAATGRFAWPAAKLTDDVSIDDHGERIAEPVTIMTTQIAAYAQDIANRRLRYASQPVARVNWKVDLRGLALSLGQLVNLTHFAGVGATGWTTHTVWVTKITTDPNETELLCTIEAEDVHDIVASTTMTIDNGGIGVAVLA